MVENPVLPIASAAAGGSPHATSRPVERRPAGIDWRALAHFLAVEMRPFYLLALAWTSAVTDVIHIVIIDRMAGRLALGTLFDEYYGLLNNTVLWAKDETDCATNSFAYKFSFNKNFDCEDLKPESEVDCSSFEAFSESVSSPRRLNEVPLAPLSGFYDDPYAPPTNPYGPPVFPIDPNNPYTPPDGFSDDSVREEVPEGEMRNLYEEECIAKEFNPVAILTWLGIALIVFVVLVNVGYFLAFGGAFHTGAYVRFSQLLRMRAWFSGLMVGIVIFFVLASIGGVAYIEYLDAMDSLESVIIAVITALLLLVMSTAEILGSGYVPFDITHASFGPIEFTRSTRSVFMTASYSFLDEICRAMVEAKLGNDESLRALLLNPSRDLPILLAIPPVPKETKSCCSCCARSSSAPAPESASSAAAAPARPSKSPDALAWVHAAFTELRSIALLFVAWHSLVGQASQNYLSSKYETVAGLTLAEEVELLPPATMDSVAPYGNKPTTPLPALWSCMEQASSALLTSPSFQINCDTTFSVEYATPTTFTIRLPMSGETPAPVIMYFIGTLLFIALFGASIAYMARFAGPFATGRYLRFTTDLRTAAWYKRLVLLTMVAIAAISIAVGAQIQHNLLSFFTSVLTLLQSLVPLATAEELPFRFDDASDGIEYRRSASGLNTSNASFVTKLVHAMLEAQLGDSTALRAMLKHPEQDTAAVLRLKPQHEVKPTGASPTAAKVLV